MLLSVHAARQAMVATVSQLQSAPVSFMSANGQRCPSACPVCKCNCNCVSRFCLAGWCSAGCEWAFHL